MNYPKHNSRLEYKKKILAEQTPSREPARKLLGVKIREWDKPSKLVSICEDCLKTIAPPTRRRIEGASGTRYCDWCGARNIIYKKSDDDKI